MHLASSSPAPVVLPHRGAEQLEETGAFVLCLTKLRQKTDGGLKP